VITSSTVVCPVHSAGPGSAAREALVRGATAARFVTASLWWTTTRSALCAYVLKKLNGYLMQ
jgi:hypothetical protein